MLASWTILIPVLLRIRSLWGLASVWLKGPMIYLAATGLVLVIVSLMALAADHAITRHDAKVKVAAIREVQVAMQKRLDQELARQRQVTEEMERGRANDEQVKANLSGELANAKLALARLKSNPGCRVSPERVRILNGKASPPKPAASAANLFGLIP